MVDYTRYIYQFLQNNWSDVQDTLSAVQGLAITVDNILQAIVFFGFLFFAFKFIRARWLTVC